MKKKQQTIMYSFNIDGEYCDISIFNPYPAGTESD